LPDYTLETIQQAIEDSLGDLVQAFPSIVQKVGKDSIAKIRNRIQENGIDADGNKLRGYSTAYKKRKAKTQDTSITNLTLSGDMWRKTDIISAQQEGDKYVVTIGGKDDHAQDKIDGNSFGNGKGGGGNYGDILRVSEKEEEELGETFNEIIQEVLDKNLK